MAKENEVLKRIDSGSRRSDTKKKITEVGHNARKRFLEIELNGAGVIVGLSSYAVLKGQPNYIGDFKKIFPEIEAHTGSFDPGEKNAFNISSVGEIPTFTKGLAAVVFTKTVLDNLTSEDKFSELANPDLVETIPITAIQDKKITLERAPLDSSFTEIIILPNNGFIPLAQLSNFDANESQDEISTDTQTSGGYKSAIGGLKSASIEGITGIYDPSIPSLAILSSAYNTESTVRVRHGATKDKFAPYTVGIYKVTEFTTTGETSGNGRLEYKTSLKLQAGQIEKKTFI